MWWIKEIVPQTRYEREAILKAFSLFFISINILLLAVGFLYYKNKVIQLENEIFLKLKNYSYTFKGKEYQLEVVPRHNNISFYQLYKDETGLYIYVPIPFVEKDVLKVIYPVEEYKRKLGEIRKEITIYFFMLTVPVALMSFFFALFSIHPIRKSTKMINRFVRDIVHDINTPVSALLLNLKMLKMKYGEEEEFLRMESSVKRLNSIYENLSLLDREVKKNEKSVNLKKLILEEIEDLKLSYPNIQVKAKLKDVVLQTDENAVRRIILNLLSNAFKHNVKNGVVEIELEKDYLKISNTSPEIKNPHRLFERYYKESQRGLGLGLSIVKKLADELGFQVEAQYREGKFTVILRF
ncbi:MAG: HAMP domain-containing histidine kinase [Aquificae bacterium]|nr:HAMP domain-containing histidine kinase [Aquificota bacterium]